MPDRTLVAALVGAVLALGAEADAQYQEIEPNDVILDATPATLAPGSTFSGEQSGNSDAFSDTPGLDSRDIWKITTPPMPRGIYKHTITGLAGSPSVYMSLMARYPDGEGGLSDNWAQFSPPDIYWYGFGKEESVLLMVNSCCDPSEPETAYTFQLQSSEPVIPAEPVGTISAGAVTISVTAVDSNGPTSDADIWLYDSDFAPIPEAGSDSTIAFPSGGSGGPSIISRTLTPGDYYLAIALADLMNDQPAPSSEANVWGGLLHYPDAVCSNNVWFADSFYELTITDSDPATEDVTFARVLPNYYEVGWLKLTVTGTASCAADLDGNNAIDVFDLLAYLNLWFEGDAAAEFTSDDPPAINVFDLLAYLDVWFAGC